MRGRRESEFKKKGERERNRERGIKSKIQRRERRNSPNLLLLASVAFMGLVALLAEVWLKGVVRF
jgi:hypothetical protein